ncbi:hypothetical protein [Halomicrobium salinisoli]|uniref:hypothetical protein n=1 Tax=Halomicrobium salinisoli TaxID=2878391 RepID=UPI001CF0B68C|nr:hypothetical protein [Halomicrobium salinisoli]
MRTESANDRVAVRRRDVLLAAGAAASAPLLSGATGRNASLGGPTVAVTEPYEAAVADLAAAFERAAGQAVAVRTVAADGADAVRERAADVLVSGRPVADGSLRRDAAVHGSAALAAAGWREPLSGRALRERWTAGEPVETWSETDPETAAALGTVAGPAADGRRLVRGSRSFQYATGRGAVGYYEVADEEIAASTAGRLASLDSRARPHEVRPDDGAVPLARIAYVHADPAAASDATEQFLEFYGRHAAADPDAVTVHEDPALAADGERLWS